MNYRLGEENNTSVTTSRPKSSSDGGAFVGRMFAALLHAAKLLLDADVRRSADVATCANKKARIETDARSIV
jgi:hypothetical protein